MRRTFRVPAAFEIGVSTSSADIDGWDSLSHAVFIMGIEQEFSVEIPVDEAYALPDVGALTSLLERLIKEQRSS